MKKNLLKIVNKMSLACFLLTVISLLLLTTRPIFSQKKPELLPVDSAPKRALRIRDELIFITGYIIEKYSQLMNHATTMAKLVSFCDIKKCQEGDCPKPQNPALAIKGNTCPQGDECTGTREDMCPDWVLQELDNEYRAAEKIVEELNSIGGVDVGLGARLAELQWQLQDLKDLLEQSKTKLSHYDPNTEELWSCWDARIRCGGIQTCSHKEAELLGIPLPTLGQQPNSELDYYICPKTYY